MAQKREKSNTKATTDEKLSFHVKICKVELRTVFLTQRIGLGPIVHIRMQKADNGQSLRQAHKT